MKNIATIDLKKYIKKKLFSPETERQEIWLHNLPNTSFLFDIINKLREKYKDETFVITQDINITNENINKKINLSNCIFKNEFTVEKSFFSCINFNNSTFKENVSFKEIIFDKNILHLHFSFDRVKFEGYKTEFINSELHNISFAESIFNSEITSFQFSKIYDGNFYKTEFRENVRFNSFGDNPKTEIQNTSFRKAIFKKQTNFEEVFFFNNIFFEKTLFEGDTFFQKAKFYQINNNINNEYKENNDIKRKSEVNFKKSNFIGNIYFSEAFFETDVDFSGSQFNTISFGNAIFDRNVRFHKTTFNNNIDFFNTSFNNLVEFYRAHFYKPIQFHFTDFLDRAIFSNTIFYREAQFLYNKVENNSYINFESAIFKRGLDISRSNFNCNLNFWNTTIEEDGEDYIFKNIDDIKYKNDFEAHNEVPSIYKQLRETYRIIKDNSYKQNNKIEALEFSKREMLVYERELKSVSSKNNNDKLLLLANKISNNFGTNWLRGILFTASAGVITYLLMLCCLPFIHNTYIIISFSFIIIIISTYSFLNKNIDSFLPILILIILSLLLTIILFKSPFLYKENICIKDYIIPDFIKILNVIDLKPFEKEENSIFNLSGLSYLFLFIGRIFIGYGYYQTIQAFRKFGKS
ncbi:pentapeptide repeat-containing protein [Capnocytophaga leadbetteri]